MPRLVGRGRGAGGRGGGAASGAAAMGKDGAAGGGKRT
jgi:hypothetical protein